MNVRENDMPKKTKSTTKFVDIAAVTARELENHLGYELSGWAESFHHLAAEGVVGRDDVNDALSELRTLLLERDALIDAAESGRLEQSIFTKYAPSLVKEVLADLPEMNVPEGTAAYYASRCQAAHLAAQTLAVA